MELNAKIIKFKFADIEKELIMFLKDILIKKGMTMFKIPDEMDVRMLRFCKEFDADRLGETYVDVHEKKQHAIYQII